MFTLFLRQYLKYYLAYRSQIAFRIFIVGLRIVLVCSLIQALYRVSGQTVIGGIDAVSAQWALVFSQTVSAYGSQGFADKIVTSIRSGQIALELISPWYYVWRKTVESIWDTMANTLLVLPWTVLIGYLFIGDFSWTWESSMLALMLTLISVIMRRLAHINIAFVAFITEEVKPFKWIWGKCEMLLGGNILPIPFMPLWMQSIALIGPFAHMGYTAGLIFARPEGAPFLQYTLTAAAWTLFFYLLACILFRSGVKRLESLGG